MDSYWHYRFIESGISIALLFGGVAIFMFFRWLKERRKRS